VAVESAVSAFDDFVILLDGVSIRPIRAIGHLTVFHRLELERIEVEVGQLCARKWAFPFPGAEVSLKDGEGFEMAFEQGHDQPVVTVNLDTTEVATIELQIVLVHNGTHYRAVAEVSVWTWADHLVGPLDYFGLVGKKDRTGSRFPMPLWPSCDTTRVRSRHGDSAGRQRERPRGDHSGGT
jgi:hypothetical protein